ncbi:MAG: YihA family ribosome biogenesis GTP-binding protein [Betaproteobacteria bacterium]|nr:YihA family ribosome biogenesis GTP-binding protein [Betaproteobacteria bacterium]
MIRFASAAFFSAATLPEQLPPSDRAEVAFAGRSNAGKSSVINALTGRNRLAFVSKTPGRTQQVVFFRVGEAGFLVDLPGYGYARVPRDVQRHWEELVAGYIRSRGGLRGLIVVMDARHPFTPLDLQLLKWITPGGVPLHVLLTKADKLSRSAAMAVLKEAAARLDGFTAGATVQLFSSLNGKGVDELKIRISRWMTK